MVLVLSMRYVCSMQYNNVFAQGTVHNDQRAGPI